MEIAEWVRKEIKEAGCGSRFAPVVLLTGGGAEMQNIEALFARELKLEEVRSVYPEYGFTESMGEHITTRAYATIGSLLLYGAKRGLCAVAVRPQSAEPQQPQTPFGDAYRRNVEESSFGGVAQTTSRPVVTPKPATPKVEEEVAPQTTLGTVEPETTEGEITVDNDRQKEGRISKFIKKMSDVFAGKDDEYTF